MPHLLKFLFIFIYTNAAYSNSDVLTNTEWEQLEKGSVVIKTKKEKKYKWPEVTIYQYINATPLESMAIFLALDHQKEFVPNLLESTPVKQISSRIVHTRYKMDLPWPIPNSIYIHSSTLNPAKILPNGKKSYSASWKMIKSDSTKFVRGSAIFSIKNGKTLFRYRNFVRPSSIFASLLERTMLYDVKKSIVAIKNYIELVKKEKPLVLKKYKDLINRSFKGEFVYLPKD